MGMWLTDPASPSLPTQLYPLELYIHLLVRCYLTGLPVSTFFFYSRGSLKDHTSSSRIMEQLHVVYGCMDVCMYAE